MDRGVASSTIFVCFLLFPFTFSSARIPLDLPGIDDTNIDSFSVSENNPAEANAILLPSEKPKFEPATLIQWEPITTDSKTSKPEAETVESTAVSTESTEASDSIPFTVFSFRPINPRIPRRPLPLSFRLGHRCRHHHHFKPWNPCLPRREISYGQNVILNKDPLARGGVRQIPARWMRFGHIVPRFSHEPRMDMSELMRRLCHRHHLGHHRHEPENKDTGFMKRIRKFLNHF